jgi:hypothetical protein
MSTLVVRPSAEQIDVGTLPAAGDPADLELGALALDGDVVVRRVGVEEPEFTEVTVGMPGTWEIVGPRDVWGGYRTQAAALREALQLADKLGLPLEVQS